MPALDTDISTAAIALVREHGDRAPIYAAMEADRLSEAGDLDGAAHWRLVLRARGVCPRWVNSRHHNLPLISSAVWNIAAIDLQKKSSYG